jgi:hypothetical protein
MIFSFDDKARSKVSRAIAHREEGRRGGGGREGGGREGAQREGKNGVQLRKMQRNDAVVQLKELSRDVLNVAGEDHGESDDRREHEIRFGAAKAGGGYWTEEEFPITIHPEGEEPGEVSADPILLRWFHGAHYLAEFVGDLQNYAVQEGAGWTLDGFKKHANLVSATSLNLMDLFLLLKQQTVEQRRLLNSQSNISTIEDVLGQEEEVGRIVAAQRSIAAKAGALGARTKNADASTHRAIVNEHCDLGGELKAIEAAVQHLLQARKFKLNREQISGTRSINLVSAAHENFKRPGLWKIGQAHVVHMAGMEAPKFNLLSETEFNEAFFKWLKEEYSFEELRHYFPTL